jgi:hypothetical protein
MKFKNFFEHWMNSQLGLDEIMSFTHHIETTLPESQVVARPGERASPEEIDDIFLAPVRNLAYGAAVAVAVTNLEVHLKGFCLLIQRQENLAKTMRDAHILHSAEEYLKKHATWAMPAFDKCRSDLHGLNELRNCLVHHAHDFDSFKARNIEKAEELLEFSLRHDDDPEIGEGYVFPHASTVRLSVDIIRQFVEGLSIATSRHYPSHYGA